MNYCDIYVHCESSHTSQITLPEIPSHISFTYNENDWTKHVTLDVGQILKHHNEIEEYLKSRYPEEYL